jgi:hypothetical protein
MTAETKNARRARWQGLGFAGTIDWAVDLQKFSDDESGTQPSKPKQKPEECKPAQKKN